MFPSDLRSELAARASSLFAIKIRYIYSIFTKRGIANRLKVTQIKLELLLDAYAV